MNPSNKFTRVIFCILLTAIFLLTASSRPVGAVTSSTERQEVSDKDIIADYEAAQLNPSLSEDEKIKAAINAYFASRYESQKILNNIDFSPVLENATSTWANKEKEKREIEIYIANLFSLRYQTYSYRLEYDTIRITPSEAIVSLRESHEIVFEILSPDVSKMSDLKHEIILHKKQNKWVIFKDDYQDELSQLMNHKTKNEIILQVNRNYQEDLKLRVTDSNHEAAMSYFSSKTLFSPSYHPLLLNNYGYNRTKARNYADAYWDTYNTDWYKTASGTDCTNYVSQALYAGQGKTPPDTGGMATASNRSYQYDWYYIWNNSGSLPWVRVQSQYNFIVNNTNKIGPAGVRSNNLCSVRLGDIVQLYNVNGTAIWDHEAIFVESPYPYCQSSSYYKVNAHTTNRYHYPLSNWAAYQMRYILIRGWKGN